MKSFIFLSELCLVEKRNPFRRDRKRMAVGSSGLMGSGLVLPGSGP